MKTYLKHSVIVLINCFVLINFATASQVPDSGSLLNQMEQNIPVPNIEMKKNSEKESDIKKENPVENNFFLIKKIEFKGNKVVSSKILHNLVKEYEGKRLNFNQINKISDKITEYYRKKKYFLSLALIPEQVMKDNVLIIQIVEGKYNQIIVLNNSHIRDRLIYSTINGLKQGDIVYKNKLDNKLLLLSDINGITSKAEFKAGKIPETSDLTIKIDDKELRSFTIFSDNDGNPATGRKRLGGSVSFFNPLKHGDVANLSILTTGNKLNYFSSSYDILLNGKGTKFGINSSFIKYKLGGSFDSIKAYGNAFNNGVSVNQPLIRQQDLSLLLKIKYTITSLKDDIDLSSYKNYRNVNTFVTSVSGNSTDDFISGGVNFWEFTSTFGKVNNTPKNNNPNTANVLGYFNKISLLAGRNQKFSYRDSMKFSLLATFASKNLDSNQKINVGGNSGVRGYAPSSLSADQGYIANLEFNHKLGTYFYGELESVTFFDTACVKVNKKPWISGVNSAILSGLGTGFNWYHSSNWMTSLSIASPLGRKSFLISPHYKYVTWFEIKKIFH